MELRSRPCILFVGQNQHNSLQLQIFFCGVSVQKQTNKQALIITSLFVFLMQKMGTMTGTHNSLDSQNDTILEQVSQHFFLLIEFMNNVLRRSHVLYQL
jgi:hypothetical protein